MLLDAARLAVGTFTIARVSAPRQVDGATWHRALALAPVVGAVLGAIAALVGWAVESVADATLLASVAVVVVLALLTRGLHLDGLADVADGLGSRRDAQAAREIMRRSDIGPFGVVALVLVLLTQVAALDALFGNLDDGAVATTVIAASVVSRTAVVLACRRGVPSAIDGLGSSAVGSVAGITATTATAFVLCGLVVAGVLLTADADALSWGLGVAGVASLIAAELWRRHCTRRFGVVTGDVLGSIEQLTWTGFVIVVALVAT